MVACLQGYAILFPVRDFVGAECCYAAVASLGDQGGCGLGFASD
jgi:hypothetical protein